MNKFLAKKQYDIVLGIGNYPSLVLSLVFTNPNIRKIGCMHLSINAIPVFWRFMARLFFSRLEMLVSLTQFDVERLKKLNSKICVIPNSTSFHTEKYASLDDKVVLALGRFDDEKDFETMIQLFGLFCNERNDWILKIRGAGPLKEQLDNLVIEKKLTDNVFILPPTRDVEAEYLSSSIVLLTSKYEGLPMVLIEAQTFGIPVISFDCETGPAEIIQDGVSGYLIDPNKKEELVTKLIELTSNESIRKEMGKKAKLNSERFSENAIVDQWIKLFHSLTKNK
jgi:glycosyltransferase involved in cell wall biosynthesis